MVETTKHEKMRFVVLFHQFEPNHQRADHWDLMLEQDGKLLTWALEESPEPGKSIPATRLDDHRIDYLELEGPVSGGRGSVSRLHAGKYSWQEKMQGRVAILEMLNEQWKIEFAEQPSEVEGSAALIVVRVSHSP